VKKGQQGTVVGVNEKNEYMVAVDTKETKFNLFNYQHIDYGYALTEYKAQGATTDKIIMLLDSSSGNYHASYVGATRAKEDIKIFTNDTEGLKQSILKEDLRVSTQSIIRDNNSKKSTHEVKEMEFQR
jgi:ATP-dependent exoDNAse (exonuclease V) alpha subunit